MYVQTKQFTLILVLKSVKFSGTFVNSGSSCDVSVTSPVFTVNYDTNSDRSWCSVTTELPGQCYSVHHHSLTSISVPRSPALRHTYRYETPHTVLHLFFPVCHLFFRWRHYCLPPSIAESRCVLPCRAHFARLFVSRFISFYKICLAPGLLAPYAILSTPIHA